MKRRLTYATFLFRRTIFVALILILIPNYIQKWTIDKDRGNNDLIKVLQADGPVTEITVNKSFPIDKDTFTADIVYVTPKQIQVTYTFHTKQKKGVWSFPTMSLKLVTPDGQQLLSHNAGSDGNSSGETGYISFDLPNKPTDRATLIYELYDRYGQIEIPLKKAGEGA
ncbi:hypothetical protein SAMN05216312_103105 [Cohnella sp. OV330]|uniref:hypothetical protein n=1 Tax=Cohnella sp. OV330 TaxID=1855288 RepID=UPI0008E1C55D|nr:hypothetical protein [Cohnella sp. OV330]SFB03558.1 hypothetical protein SAMN05216312_103105 [Cohnella sp. OV330]